MCGIVGIFQKNVNNYLNVSNAINVINHRGPDSKGIWRDEFISLGSIRLKVVDLDENSDQPLISKNKKYVLTYNGEVYNYLKLKKKFNIKTKTNSDTELILELFSKLGPKTFSLLEGMFAISIYDTIAKKLYLARDIFGVKPIYYFSKKKKFLFCSEIKGILEIEKNIAINNQSIVNLIKWGGLDNTADTWFEKIQSLEPGSFIEIDNNFKIKKTKYYFLENNIKKDIFRKKDIPHMFNKLLKKSVKDQSQTIRSIGTNLSGGVDSSIVTAFLKEINTDIQTYTFGYNERKFDERPFAETVSKKLKVENFTSVTNSNDINNNFLNTLIMQDEPFTSFRQVSHHKLYEDFKINGSTVILESSGGDEIGGGYTGFLWPLFLDQIKIIGYDKALDNLIKNLKIHKFNKSKIDSFMKAGSYNQQFYGSSTSDGQKIINSECILENFNKKYDNGPPTYKKIFDSHLLNSQYIELFHTKLPRGLRYVDRASSSSGRESRVPLLSREIVEFCFSIPNELKIRDGELRWFMKKSLNYLNKKNIKLTNKRSIADPQRIWMKKNLKHLFLSVFKSKKFKNRGIFNQKEVLKSYYNFLKDNNAHSLGLFQIFITEIWIRLFFDNNHRNFKNEKLNNFINYTN